MVISIVYMFATLGSHVDLSDVTNLFLALFWIKMILKLSKYIKADMGVAFDFQGNVAWDTVNLFSPSWVANPQKRV